MEARLSLLVELKDQPGALQAALRPFSELGINLTHIESRPRRGGSFDFYVDCAAEEDSPAIDELVRRLEEIAERLLVLDRKAVPWFPRHISELDLIANRTLDAGDDLSADHPGFNDPEYRARRAKIDQLAREYRHGAVIPRVDYTREEQGVWGEVYRQLVALQDKYACPEYTSALRAMEHSCGYGPDSIPQAQDINEFLLERTGFRLRPVAGLLSSRDFLNGLAFRVFFSTQYIRHSSRPLYTPEPDICHELIGHAPMFADSAFADLSQEIGLASLGASDAQIERLARCYWYSIEFGLVRAADSYQAYGAGLLSSFGELSYACGEDESRKPEYRPWEPKQAAEQDFPITDYQPVYFVAESLHDAKQRMRSFCRELPRPFYARYHAATEQIWVDRAVKRT